MSCVPGTTSVVRICRVDTDTIGIRASIAAVVALIDAEIARGIAPERIVLAGFSQGGAIVLHAGLTYPQRCWVGYWRYRRIWPCRRH